MRRGDRNPLKPYAVRTADGCLLGEWADPTWARERFAQAVRDQERMDLSVRYVLDFPEES